MGKPVQLQAANIAMTPFGKIVLNPEIFVKKQQSKQSRSKGRSSVYLSIGASLQGPEVRPDNPFIDPGLLENRWFLLSGR